jgi:DNA-binding MarR family transcriptional regulator
MGRTQSRRRRTRVLLTERDRLILELAAEHRLILPAHAASALDVAPSTAAGRMRSLSRAGYLDRRRLFANQPACYLITRRGLEVIDSALPKPRIDLRAYAHDVGLAWLWLAARGGTFGPVDEVLSERTLRSRDGARPPGSDVQPLGVRLGGVGPGGRERLHYPDLLLLTPQGHRIAIELELSSKGRTRRERILAGYGSDVRIDAVLYLVDRPPVSRSIQASARRLGISPRVHVQWVRQSERPREPAARTPERARVAAAGRER